MARAKFVTIHGIRRKVAQSAASGQSPDEPVMVHQRPQNMKLGRRSDDEGGGRCLLPGFPMLCNAKCIALALSSIKLHPLRLKARFGDARPFLYLSWPPSPPNTPRPPNGRSWRSSIPLCLDSMSSASTRIGSCLPVPTLGRFTCWVKARGSGTPVHKLPWWPVRACGCWWRTATVISAARRRNRSRRTNVRNLLRSCLHRASGLISCLTFCPP